MKTTDPNTMIKARISLPIVAVTRKRNTPASKSSSVVVVESDYVCVVATKCVREA